MRIDPKIAELLNDQIHHELTASYTYLGMAAYFDADGLEGFAKWFRIHSDEERAHAMRLFDFLSASNVPVTLKPLQAPAVSYQSASHALETALRHEEGVTDQIKSIFAAAMSAGEFTVQPLLHWFLEEQVEEEDLFDTTLERVKAATSRFDLLTLDQEMAGRGAEEA